MRICCSIHFGKKPLFRICPKAMDPLCYDRPEFYELVPHLHAIESHFTPPSDSTPHTFTFFFSVPPPPLLSHKLSAPHIFQQNAQLIETQSLRHHLFAWSLSEHSPNNHRHPRHPLPLTVWLCRLDSTRNDRKDCGDDKQRKPWCCVGE